MAEPSSTTKPAGSPAPFKVDAQEARTEYDDTGKQALVWRVHYTTPSGVKGWVEVPEAQYDAQHVADVISSKVSHLEAVGQIGNA